MGLFGGEIKVQCSTATDTKIGKLGTLLVLIGADIFLMYLVKGVTMKQNTVSIVR